MGLGVAEQLHSQRYPTGERDFCSDANRDFYQNFRSIQIQLALCIFRLAVPFTVASCIFIAFKYAKNSLIQL